MLCTGTALIGFCAAKSHHVWAFLVLVCNREKLRTCCRDPEALTVPFSELAAIRVERGRTRFIFTPAAAFIRNAFEH